MTAEKDNFAKGYFFGITTLAIGMAVGASLAYMALTKGIEIGIYAMHVSTPQTANTYPPYDAPSYPTTPQVRVEPSLQPQEYATGSYVTNPLTFIVEESSYVVCFDPALMKAGPDEQSTPQEVGSYYRDVLYCGSFFNDDLHGGSYRDNPGEERP